MYNFDMHTYSTHTWDDYDSSLTFKLNYSNIFLLINLNKDDWAKSKCSCGWFMKNYNCYHLIVVATNLGLVMTIVTYGESISTQQNLI